MNRKKPNILLTCLTIVGLCMSMCLAPMGCGTTPERAALTAAGVQVLTVDAAMKAFHDQAVAGKVTQAQLDAVNKWYPVYYNAGVIQKQAFKAYVASKSPDTKQALDVAVASFLSAESNIVAILTQTLGNVRIVKKAGNQ